MEELGKGCLHTGLQSKGSLASEVLLAGFVLTEVGKVLVCFSGALENSPSAAVVPGWEAPPPYCNLLFTEPCHELNFFHHLPAAFQFLGLPCLKCCK